MEGFITSNVSIDLCDFQLEAITSSSVCNYQIPFYILGKYGVNTVGDAVEFVKLFNNFIKVFEKRYSKALTYMYDKDVAKMLEYVGYKLDYEEIDDIPHWSISGFNKYKFINYKNAEVTHVEQQHYVENEYAACDKLIFTFNSRVDRGTFLTFLEVNKLNTSSKDMMSKNHAEIVGYRNVWEYIWVRVL